MTVNIDIINWRALAPGLTNQQDWLAWATQTCAVNITEAVFPDCHHIPMMARRRMSIGSRLAVECSLQILAEGQADIAIFTSRHGELLRTYNVLQQLGQQHTVSPTDFAMSVHNTAAGLLTIIAKNTLPTVSLAAGQDSFQQGMIEAAALLACGEADRVLLVDVEGVLPDVYQPFATENAFPYALALLLGKGNYLTCQSLPASSELSRMSQPQGLVFLQHWLSASTEFILPGPTQQWLWSRV